MARTARKTTKPVETPIASTGRGRAPSPENQERLDHILARTKEQPGIESPVLAGELNITTLQCSQLTDRLVKSGEIEIFKKANGVRMNFLPKDLNKARAKLEKQFEADVAAREANKAANADKFAKLKESAAAKKAAGKKAAGADKESDASAPKASGRRRKASA